jgi:hypothetical protein
MKRNIRGPSAANPVMYSVCIDIKTPKGPEKRVFCKLEQTKLDETIGRYVRRHGAPVNLSDIKGTTILDFYTKEVGGTWELQLTYTAVSGNVEQRQEEAVVNLPPVEAEPETPQPEQIKALMDANLVTKVNQYGY